MLGTVPGLQGGLLTAVSADTRINRKDWGLSWNVALETGGWLVGDEITIHIEFELMAAARELVATTA
jgi:polyisoprenoid-binding protein YceI